MSQQVGTALVLTAFTIVAVAFARGADPVAARLHGLQVAILAVAALALAAATFAAVTVRRTTGPAARRRGAGPSAPRKPEYPLADDVELDL
jgi:hypothetical protein